MSFYCNKCGEINYSYVIFEGTKCEKCGNDKFRHSPLPKLKR